MALPLPPRWLCRSRRCCGLERRSPAVHIRSPAWMLVRAGDLLIRPSTAPVRTGLSGRPGGVSCAVRPEQPNRCARALPARPLMLAGPHSLIGFATKERGVTSGDPAALRAAGSVVPSSQEAGLPRRGRRVPTAGFRGCPGLPVLRSPAAPVGGHSRRPGRCARHRRHLRPDRWQVVDRAPDAVAAVPAAAGSRRRPDR